MDNQDQQLPVLLRVVSKRPHREARVKAYLRHTWDAMPGCAEPNATLQAYQSARGYWFIYYHSGEHRAYDFAIQFLDDPTDLTRKEALEYFLQVGSS